MYSEDDVVTDALQSLARDHLTRSDAALSTPRAPGLYAFRGDSAAWAQLGLAPSFEGQPLYVGKSESSLNGRDVGTHFAVGRTGSSTLRRSLAALMANDLGLLAVPRNPALPVRGGHFTLDSQSEARLSAWMEERLTLATWVKPGDVVLDEIETLVLRRLRPPLNISKVGESRATLRAARRRLAAQARGGAVGPRP